MGTLNNTMGDLAFGAVVVTAGVPAFGGQRGFADAIIDNGVGDYTLTLSNAQALATAGIVSVTPAGAVPCGFAAEVASASTIRCRFFSLTVVPVVAVVDVNFWIRVSPLSPA